MSLFSNGWALLLATRLPNQHTPHTLENSCRQPLNHLLDTVGALFQIRIDFFKWTWWGELVKMTVKWDFKAYDTDFTIFLIALRLINPCIRHMRLHFTLKVVINGLSKRHVLVITQTGISFNIAFAIGTNVGLGVTLTECIQNGFQLRCTQANAIICKSGFECLLKCLAVAIKRFWVNRLTGCC